MDRKQSSQMMTGVLMIAIGLIFLADRLTIFPHMSLGRLWPLILIALGVGKLASGDGDGRRTGGVWLIFLGGLFLLHTFHVLTLATTWPLFIVAGGLSILFGRKDAPAPTPGKDQSHG